VFNFKRILHKIPLVKSKIGTYAAALYLLKEEMESEEYNTLLEYLESHKALSGVRKLTEELTKGKAICLLGEDNMTTEIIKEIEEDALGEAGLNLRTLATLGMGVEAKKDIKLGQELDYYDNKVGDKHSGKVVKISSSGYEIEDEKTKKKTKFTYFDKSKAQKLMKTVEEDAPANNMGDGNVAVKDAPFVDDEKSKKVDGRTKSFKDIMRRIRERKLKEEERAIKAKLRAMGISESMLEGTESTVQEGSDVEGETYKEYFAKCLKKFGVKSPAELEGKKKVEFFNYVDDNWAAAVEKD
jgi:hypothetical protein